MLKKSIIFAAAAVVSVLPFATSAMAAEDLKTYELIIKDHKFTPDRIEVPAGEPFYLLVKNQDSGVEEFDSYDLHREKVIHGGRQAKIKLLGLKPGTYNFIGEFHQKTATGAVIAK